MVDTFTSQDLVDNDGNITQVIQKQHNQRKEDFIRTKLAEKMGGRKEGERENNQQEGKESEIIPSHLLKLSLCFFLFLLFF